MALFHVSQNLCFQPIRIKTFDLFVHCYNWYFLIYAFLVGRETADFVQGKNLKDYDRLECKFPDFHFLKKYLSGCWMRRKPSHWHKNWQMQSLTRIFIFFEYVQQVMSIQFYVAKNQNKNKNLRYTLWTFSPNTHISAYRNFWFWYLA